MKTITKIILDTNEEANNLLDIITEKISTYGALATGDLYDILDELGYLPADIVMGPPTITDFNTLGWVTVDGFKIAPYSLFRRSIFALLVPEATTLEF